jgi:hypothetical protein
MKYKLQFNNKTTYLFSFLKLIALLLVNTSFTQVKTTNNNVWLHYTGKNKLTNNVSFSLEASMRYANGFNEKQQYFIRPSLDYQLTKKFNISAGYSYFNTYVYGNPSLNKINTPEEQIWLQVNYTHSNGQFKYIHRLRDELRYIGIPVKSGNNTSIEYYEYRNRLRYMFLLNYTITENNQKPKLFSVIGNEVFINIGTNAGKTLINQNRIIGGLGYNIDNNQQLQLNYIHQNIWNFSNTLQENNPTVRISYITNLDFSKKE